MRYPITVAQLKAMITFLPDECEILFPDSISPESIDRLVKAMRRALHELSADTGHKDYVRTANAEAVIRNALVAAGEKL
jgi:hypothetical protein